MLRVAKAEGKTEVILFNDCSPDDSQSIIDDYAAKYPGVVRKMRSEHNLGVGNARTEMCKNARGRYILSFDQDDIMLPFDLGGIVRMLDRNPKYAASYSRKYLFNSKGLTGEVHGGSLSEFNAFFAPKLNINAMVIRADVLAAHEWFRPVPGCAINDDVFLMIRLGADCDYLYDVDNPRVLYRVHEKQNSRLFHHEDQNPFRWMAEYMTKRKPELYARILGNDPPRLTASNRKWVLGLMGAAVFLVQKNAPLALSIVQKACEIAPDDYGTWEQLIRVLAIARKPEKTIAETFRAASERFRGEPVDRELQLAIAYGTVCRARRVPIPEDVSKRLNELQSLYAKPPRIVLDNLPK